MPTLLHMPHEIINEIAGYLPNAVDIVNFASVCKALQDVIYHERAACWRWVFAAVYDLPPVKAVSAIRERYVQRDILRRPLVFKFGNGLAARGRYVKAEEEAVNVLRDLIIESYSAPIEEGGESNNVKCLRFVANHTNICNANNYWNRGLGQPTRLFQAVHVTLLSFQLQATLRRASTSTPGDLYPISQKAVYAHPDQVVGLFADDKYMSVNLDLVSHLSNFFKYHITCYEEASLYDVYGALRKSEKPNVWDSQILQGPQKLRKHWKGTFASLADDQMELLRSYKTGEHFVQDQWYLDYGLMDLELDFGPVTMRDGAWPQMWDESLASTPTIRLLDALKQWSTDWIKSQKDPRHFVNTTTTEYLEMSTDLSDTAKFAWRQYVADLKPDPAIPEQWQALEDDFREKYNTNGLPAHIVNPKPKKRPAPLRTAEAGKDYFHFKGEGIDEGAEFKVRGNIHAVAPVEDIPGWQRITFMKWFTGDGGKDHPICFEGVVLPGNKIILGRWWALYDDDDRREIGPFIFWCVDHES